MPSFRLYFTIFLMWWSRSRPPSRCPLAPFAGHLSFFLAFQIYKITLRNPPRDSVTVRTIRSFQILPCSENWEVPFSVRSFSSELFFIATKFSASRWVESTSREAEQQQEGVSVIILQIGCDDVGPTFKARWGPEAFGFGIGLHSVWCGVFSGGCCLIVNFCVSNYKLWSGVSGLDGPSFFCFFCFGWGPSSLFE